MKITAWKPRKFLASLVGVLAVLFWCGLCPGQMPHNVILMVGDGQGYNSVQAAAYYAGAAPAYTAFPVKLGMSTYPHGGGYDPRAAWQEFDYVRQGATDSGAAATALATGVKTYNGAISVDPTRRSLTTIAEVAVQQGKAAGVVTSVPFSHATPAAMAAHNIDRGNYEAIAQEMLAGPLTVIMGAGHPEFDNNGSGVKPVSPGRYRYVGGQGVWEALKQGRHLGWTLLETRREFEDLANGRMPIPAKVLGVAQAHNTLQQKRAGDPRAAPYGEPLNKGLPTLAVMTRAALNVLARNPRGFFLMVEGGAIDWAAHEQQLGRLIEEELDFNHAVAAVVEWVEAHGGWDKTLLVVTSDHETGHLWGPGSSNPQAFALLKDRGAGALPEAAFYSDEHTNALVPLYAKGAGAALFAAYADRFDPKRGPYLDNTEVFRVMVGQAAPRQTRTGAAEGEGALPKAAGF
jgi:alkaline phosphatase